MRCLSDLLVNSYSMSSPKREEGGCEADDDDTCSSASSTTFEGLDDSSVKTAAPSTGVSPQTPSASSQTLEPFAHQVRPNE